MAVHCLTDWLIVYVFLLFHSCKDCIIKTSTFKQACLPRPIMIRGSEVIHIFSAIFVTNNLVHSLEEIPLVNDLFAGCKCAMLFQKPNHQMVDRRPIYDIIIIIDLTSIPIRLNVLDNQLEFALKLLNDVCVELLLSLKLPPACIKTTKKNCA